VMSLRDKVIRLVIREQVQGWVEEGGFPDAEAGAEWILTHRATPHDLLVWISDALGEEW
jgi:hypothetical protein